MFLIMSHSLFSTLLNLLGDAVAFVKQSASCVSLVHQFTEMSFFFFFQVSLLWCIHQPSASFLLMFLWDALNLTMISGFDLTTRDSYFSILVEVFTHQKTHISLIMSSEENTRLWPRNLQISTKLSGNVIASKALLSTISIDYFQRHPFLSQAKVL